LETFRQFGAANLVDNNQLADAHLRHYSAVARTAGEIYHGTQPREAVSLFVADTSW
jgi:hypothetical protein